MVKLNKIYTRTGDDGTTGLVDGSRVAKHAVRMEAIGSVDEANSALGLAALALAGGPHAADIARIQNDLFDLGADLATPGDDFAPSPMVLRMVPEQTAWLEQAIDALNADLAPLTSFILPGGSEAAGRVHVGGGAGQPGRARLYQPLVGLPFCLGPRDQCRVRGRCVVGAWSQPRRLICRQSEDLPAFLSPEMNLELLA